MNVEELIQRCLISEDSLLTYPFSEKTYEKTPVIRHKSNNKWYALIFELEGELCINLKASPIDISALKEQYPNFVKPAWHMNKKHWCRVVVNLAPTEVLDAIIKISFDITENKRLKSK